MINNLKVNDILELDVEDITDWTIFTLEGPITPDGIYLLEI